MTESISSFINAIRFFLAAWVVLGHACALGLWTLPAQQWLIDNSHEAVILFLVLSGVVISDSAVKRHRSGWAFFEIRASRVLSVVIPVMVMTLALDNFALLTLPEATFTRHYGEIDWRYGGFLAQAKQVLWAFSFLGHAWFARVTPLSIVPYWSLGYEVWFYVLFGIWFFVRGRLWRYSAMVFVLLIMGPSYWLLLPCWWLGVIAARMHNHWELSPKQGRLVFVVAIALLVYFKVSGAELALQQAGAEPFGGLDTPAMGYSRWYFGDLYNALLFATALFGLHHARWRLPQALAAWFDWAAGYNFTCYLVHYPVFMFLAAHEIANPTIRAVLAGVSLLAMTWLIGQVGERRGAFWRALFGRLGEKLRRPIVLPRQTGV